VRKEKKQNRDLAIQLIVILAGELIRAQKGSSAKNPLLSLWRKESTRRGEGKRGGTLNPKMEVVAWKGAFIY